MAVIYSGKNKGMTALAIAKAWWLSKTRLIEPLEPVDFSPN